jgi:hypothetical protein
MTTNEKVNGLTLEEWMKRVDRVVLRLAGVSVHDLADQTFWDWWHDGMKPSEAARLTLADDGYPEDLL